MKFTFSVIICGALAAVGFAASDQYRLDLSNSRVGELPKGWTAEKTGEGPGSVWKVVEDKSAPGGGKALAQTSAEGPRRLFNLCIAEKPRFKDLDLTVAFKSVAGVVDQGGGPIWRCRDANNYYIARMNPLEDNLRIYKVVDGKRSKVASADVTLPEGKWYTLRIVARGDRIQCFLDGKQYLDVQDTSFSDSGKIGLWTKADARTYFADLRVVGE